MISARVTLAAGRQAVNAGARLHHGRASRAKLMGRLKPRKQFDERLASYRAGLNDREIAQKEGCHFTAVCKWRVRYGLAPNGERKAPLTPEQRAARMLLYSFGYSDGRIAREQGVTENPIKRWRVRLGLAPNRPVPQRNARSRKRTDATARLMRRIKVALPAYLSPADRDEAAQDLMIAVLSGAIPIAEIERRAKLMGNAVIASFADKWGARSLDEEIGDSDGFTLLDTMADEGASSWLEEMGATIW